MIDNVNNNLDNQMITESQINKTSELAKLNGKASSYATFNRDYLIDETDISKDALKLYEREKDVKNFSKLLSSISNDEVDGLMSALFQKGVVDIDDVNVLSELAGNKKFIGDILE